jgi:ParB-like chromosome segregation protein Spo0J
MKTTIVKISEVKQNPNNPRTIRDDKFERLVTSIKAFPEMLNIRPIVVNNDMVVLGGNMRLKACREAGLKQVPIIVAGELTEEQQREFIIKDNVSGGDWDWSALTSEWDTEQLEEWGLDIPEFNDNMTNNEDYEGLDQLSKLDKFLNAELKRMFLVYDNGTFENVVKWFNGQQEKHELENHSQVILKLMENENI